MQWLEWCSICNSRPADGTLRIVEPGTEEIVPLPACLHCVAEIPKDDWAGGEIIIKQPSR